MYFSIFQQSPADKPVATEGCDETHLHLTTKESMNQPFHTVTTNLS